MVPAPPWKAASANDAPTLAAFASRLGRHTGLYAASSLATLVLSFASILALAHLLSPPEFGRLAVLLFFAALLTVAYNLGSLQGSLMWVYGSTGEEEADDDRSSGPAGRKRQALGSVLLLTALIGLVGTLAVTALAEPLSGLLTNQQGDATNVILAAVCGALGSMWRLVSNIPRMERRPVAFGLVTNARPAAVACLTIPLAASGYGIRGVLVGTAIGTAVALAPGLLVSRRSFAWGFDVDGLRASMRRGAVFIPVIVSFWIVQNVDLFLLSKYATEEQVGYYRVASRIGAVVSYFVSAFLMAWGPLERTPMATALDEARGVGNVRGRLTHYYLITSVGVLVLFSLVGGVLVQYVVPEFAAAAPLIPLTGLGFVVYGAFVVFYRAARFPLKRRIYSLLAITAALSFLGTAMLLIPVLGAIGAALASVVAFGIGSAGLVLIARRSVDPIQIDYPRLVPGLIVAALCLVVINRFGEHGGTLNLLIATAAAASYPFLLVLTGAVPRRDARSAFRLIRTALSPGTSREELLRRFDNAAAEDRTVVELLVRDGLSAATAADRLNRPEDEVLANFVAALRRLGGLPADGADDLAVGRYLLSRDAVAEQEAMAKRLYARGVTAQELDRIETIADRLRSRRGRRRSPRLSRVVPRGD